MCVARFLICWTSAGLLAAIAAALPPILRCSDGECIHEGKLEMYCCMGDDDDAKLKSDEVVVSTLLAPFRCCCRGGTE